MLNYANLNDVEFEYLCQDIMSKKLNVNLRRFAAGRDGGIDLVDDTYKKNIVVQVKCFIETSVSTLIASLKKELPKVQALKPKQYYVCCSKQLSPANIKKIYLIFADYMYSDANIITLNEVEDFLTDGTNVDILKKHYKLWISSTNILQEIYNNTIFIDCESLLSSIHMDERFFVQTTAYDEALQCLSKNRTLFITGDPGVGKTVTSKMLILKYATEGYCVRHTTDITDLSALKNALSKDKASREIILLDDCFGQAYFSMKESQGNELLSLIRYINRFKNKLLILNSRVTIYKEAQARTPELVRSFENKEFRIQIIDMTVISDIEKAKILYNHLYFNSNIDAYFQAVKKDRNYRKIIQHPNYNPRIIEYISNPNRYKGILPEKYYDFISLHLNNPQMIWDNEYEDRIKNVDRILLMTLFSLTNTTACFELTKKCFNVRIQTLPDVDNTIDQFNRAILRLQESFIKIVDENGKKKLSMVNPSVNDYLKSKIESNGNGPDRENLLRFAVTVVQNRRLLSKEDASLRVSRLFETGEILNYFFESDEEKNAFITYFVAFNSIKETRYAEYIHSYLKNICDVNDFENSKISAFDVWHKLFSKDLVAFYSIDTLLLDFTILRNIFSQFALANLAEAIGSCYTYFEIEDGFIDLCEKVLTDAIREHCSYVEASDFDIDISKKLSEQSHYDYSEGPDVDAATEAIEKEIEESVLKEIEEILDNLPGDLGGGWSMDELLDVEIYGVESLIESYLERDYDDDKYDGNMSYDYKDIDLIFNR